MKTKSSLVRGLLLGLSVLCVCLFCGGCASTGGGLAPADTKIIAKAAVQYGVFKVVEKNPAKAASVLSISHAVREVAGGEGFNTVDLLMGFVRLKLSTAKLDGADQMLAGVLLDEIESQLKAKIGTGPLTSEKLLIVGEVAGWVEDAAKLAAAPVS